MIKSLCNGVALPQLPTEAALPYAVLLKTATKYNRNKSLPVYVIMFSANPFLYYSGRILFFTDVEYKCYQAITEGDKWAELSLSVGGGSGNLATVPSGSTYVWCNEDIPLYPDMTVRYAGSAAEAVDGADMPTVVILPEYQYTFSQGKTPPKSLPCAATSPDGGTISYSWRKLVNGADGGEVSKSAYFTPPTDEVGETVYYCYVANERNGTRTAVYTKDATVTVKAFDYQAFVQGWIVGKRLAAMRGRQPDTGTSVLGRAVLGTMILGGE